jgi:uncharacterized C2H2 Zn-finger protein
MTEWQAIPAKCPDCGRDFPSRRQMSLHGRKKHRWLVSHTVRVMEENPARKAEKQGGAS